LLSSQQDSHDLHDFRVGHGLTWRTVFGVSRPPLAALLPDATRTRQPRRHPAAAPAAPALANRRRRAAAHAPKAAPQDEPVFKMLADILVGTDRVYDRAFPNTSVMQGHASTGQFPLDAVRACSQAPGFRALPIEVQRRLLDKDINDVFIPEACLRGRITSAFYNANGYAEFPGFYPEGRDHQNVSNGDAVNITHFHHQAAVQAAQQAAEEEAAAKAAAEAAKLAEGEALFKAFVLAGGVQNHTVKADTRHGKLVMVLKYLKYKEVTGQNIPRKLTDALPLVEGYVGRAVAARAQRTAVAAAAAAADGEAAAPMVAAADPAGAVAAAAAGAQ